MNVFSFVGNLGRDCRTGNAGGTAVVSFAVAVKSGFGQNEQTIWVDCALWGRQAESRLPEFLVKGQQVAVSGEMGTREHEGKTYITCRVNSVNLVGKRDDNQGQHQGGGYQHAQQQAPQQQRQQAPQQKAQQGGQPPMDFDSDVPF